MTIKKKTTKNQGSTLEVADRRRRSSSQSPLKIVPRDKSADEPGTHQQTLTADRHTRAVAAIQLMFRLWPMDATRYIMRASAPNKVRDEILEARWIEQLPKGPSYVVPPPPREQDVPVTPTALAAQLFGQMLEREAAESKGKFTVTPVRIDWDEERRQTLAEGGADIELLLRRAPSKGDRTQMLFGVIAAGEHDDGSEMPWTVLRDLSWQLAAYRCISGMKDQFPCFQTIPLYLWPGTGLHDPQENCSVWTGDLELPGILGKLVKTNAKERATRRKMNRERLERHQELDQLRREAAARRKALMGKAGITGKQLAKLVPTIDIDNDFISMIQHYDIVRLWEEPFDTLLESLPPGCLGLALFGYRPPNVSAEHALERCAFELRRALQRNPALDAQRAGLSLAALGSVFVDSNHVARLLHRMKLLASS